MQIINKILFPRIIVDNFLKYLLEVDFNY